MSETESGDRFEAVLVVVLYVVPLTATIALLAWLGLPGLALALLAVEAAVSAAVVRAKQPEDGRRLSAALVVLVTVSLVAAAGAFVLLARV